MIKLSVLDQSAVPEGSSPQDALQQTVDLAQLTERLGYTRYWVAEHHNIEGLAGSSPEILIGQIAAHTHSMLVGSGGVLLPQYSPYKVVENFRVLSNLHPGRIDLGMGRSPGGNLKTRRALTDGVRKSLNDFPGQVQDVTYFLKDNLPDDHPYYGVTATPVSENGPYPWLLGVGLGSAQTAADLGLGLTFGHFINPDQGEEALANYRASFQASDFLKEPQTCVCVFVVCADTEAEAERLATSQDLWLLQIEKGEKKGIPTVEQAQSYPYTEQDRIRIEKNRRRMIVGTPDQVKANILTLQETYQTDEFMIITNIHDPASKRYSYQCLAQAFQLEQPSL
ncbi:LLM class flavin-dependent oxidoreductase [Tuberibacillus sp. Marseille-P3662]|uniref:LLM class flavin-dependent oxidoreductase n=1 Tax=Tuberibacillus sp. Marseille-P3662 TaxID=1965358 RepID=UPI000A1CD78E|nr:LLM class flavin-dependent oxidoreductase [Tuberibacillus sp. Marseille-P3662]